MNLLAEDVLTANEALPRFPMPRRPLSPPIAFANLQQEEGLAPVRLWDGKQAWLATRYEDVRALLADNRFSAVPSTPGFPNISEGRASLVYGEAPSFIRMDPPDQTRIRRMLTQEFTLQRVAAMRPTVERLVNRLIDQMIAGPKPVDFVKAFAMALPSILMAEILGVPIADQDFFEDRGARRIDFSLPPGESLKAGQEFRAYVGALIAAKRANLDTEDDLISRLIRNHIIPGNLSETEAQTTIELLIIAGHETTAHSIALSLLLLLLDRKNWDTLRTNEDPAVAKAAIEEMLRYTTVVQYMCGRVAREDVEFKGQTIRKGEGILPMLNQANRDPARFHDPELFDPFRAIKSPHVAFGFGVHQCLGQPLARLEMEVTFDILPKRLPTLDLAVPLSQVQFKGESITHGVQSAPVTW